MANKFDVSRSVDRAEEARGEGIPLTDRIINGLRWLALNYGWPNRAARARWNRIRDRWLEMATELDQRDSLPAGHTRARFDLMEALMAGRSDTIKIICSDGVARELRLSSARAPNRGEFELPCVLELVDGACVRLTREPRGGATDKLGVLDLCELLPAVQMFPGARVGGADPEDVERAEARQEAML